MQKTTKNKKEKLQQKIVRLVREKPQMKSDILSIVCKDISERGLQRLLREMEEQGIIVSEGQTSAKVYKAVSQKKPDNTILIDSVINPEEIPNQRTFLEYKVYLKRYFSLPRERRGFRGYEYARLQHYHPNQSKILAPQTQEIMHATPSWDANEELGATYNIEVTATFLKQFSFNSSRLEGAVKSLAETLEILENPGLEGNDHKTIIVINHRRAVDAMVKWITYPEYALEESLTLGSKPIKELHMLLMEGLLKDDSEGEVREKPVEISASSYTPTSQPAQLETFLNEIAIKSTRIDEIYERSFFLLLHISYLQAFLDGNKRTARLVSNIPLISHRSTPHVFFEIQEDDFDMAIVYYYETNDHRPLESLWLESYKKGSHLFQRSQDEFKSANRAKVELSHLRKLAIKAIVENRLSPKESKKLMAKLFIESAFSKKYDLSTFESLVLTACEKLAKTGIGSKVYELSDEQILKWTKLWLPKNSLRN